MKKKLSPKMIKNQEDELLVFLDILPAAVHKRLDMIGTDGLIEVVLDYGRYAEARYLDRIERMHDILVTEDDIEFIVKALGEFGEDNRAGIERTIHRISCIRNRKGKVIGLTCRVGRALQGTIDLIDDIVRSGKSILMLGKPGIGKTTKLREVARVLADEVERRVVIVDTSNEIAGDGDVPHPAIGSSRRMQVLSPSDQYRVMIEAVENHMPEVIVIDEIGTDLEASASRTIAERGVQLVGTAHGQTLENLLLNPTLSDLVGGVQVVTLSDDEAKRRGTQKTILERKAPPTFDVVVEILDYDRLAVHMDVSKTVDLILKGVTPRPQIRSRTATGINIDNSSAIEKQTNSSDVQRELLEDIPGLKERQLDTKKSKKSSRSVDNEKQGRAVKKEWRIYAFGVNQSRIERAMLESDIAGEVTDDFHNADAVLIIRTTYQRRPSKLKELDKSVPVLVVKSNSYGQILHAVENLSKMPTKGANGGEGAIEEVLAVVNKVLDTGRYQDLAPQDMKVRKMQFQVIKSHGLDAVAMGTGAGRFLRIYPA